jgi:hypothetical protein
MAGTVIKDAYVIHAAAVNPIGTVSIVNCEVNVGGGAGTSMTAYIKDSNVTLLRASAVGCQIVNSDVSGIRAGNGGAISLLGCKGYCALQLATNAADTIVVAGGSITIVPDGSNTAGTLTVYGSAFVIDNSAGAGIVITNNSQSIKKIHTLDIWSTYQTTVTLTNGAGNKALPNITIAALPTTATIQRAVMMLKFRIIENTNAAANSVSGAQNIRCQKAVGGAYITGITLAGGELAVPVAIRESGDVMIGDADIKAQVPAAGAVMNFQWTAGVAAQNNLVLVDCQVGIRIFYSV